MFSYADELVGLGQPEWLPLLQYVARLHEQTIEPAREPLPHDWENIGPGYCYGPAFGHWDIAHAISDSLPYDPQHVHKQFENYFATQLADGLLPGVLWMREEPHWSTTSTHPPLWPMVMDDFVAMYADSDNAMVMRLLSQAYECLRYNLQWFEANRRVDGPGFFYTDILDHNWESGVDEGIRFLDTQQGAFACVDATSHAYLMYETLERWRQLLDRDESELARYAGEAKLLEDYICNELFLDATGFFHDSWSVHDERLRCFAFEGFFPMIVGAATEEQVNRLIDEYLLNDEHFFSEHPIPTVSMSDPRFELRMWRGPAWNSMTWWAARGCMRYGRKDAAKIIMGRALDASAKQFERTGTIWEFYHPHVGDQLEVLRKPHTPYNNPCQDYLGHNPVIAMAHLYALACD